jgi:site-specific recombinase
MGGGAFVALMAILKVFVYYWHLPPFPEAFCYSMIYSIGFIIILITGSTLATKQPAMTAATIASSLHETKENEVSISNMVLLIAKTSRSQFVAFIGNLAIVFPLAWLLAWAYHWCYGTHIMDLAKAHKSIHEIHPWQSGALFYAAFAGVFLFLAGIISGYYDNKVVYNQIPQRLRHHKLFKKVLGVKVLGKLSYYVEHQLGSLAGNFYLGIFLGSAATIGFMFGIPLEVRHITISTGSIAIAFASQNNHITTPDLISSVLGIIGIGFLNFAVSFGLALLLALKSRGVHFQQKRELLRELRLYMIKKPTAFFFPTKDAN